MTAAVLLTVLLVLLALFQLALALGAPLGRFAWGGQHRVLPTGLRVGSALGIATYVLIAVLALDRTGAVDVLPDRFSRVGMWVVLAYFVLGIGLNAASRSESERRVMVPVTVVLAALSLLVVLG
ncbi:hypothetical protein [Knoellia aerolata]|uniref:Membrane protein n=1 Tax=Knoellia aerolata DSM 18566 TaxID=1385519 RepID=A0A0A0JV21_9MICO|nr:hypothetical protein [Knoellia aerolata]KGN40529.1 membrane protein [Knoellia aerolata DSM 18566]